MDIYTFKGDKYFISSSLIKDKSYSLCVLGVFPYSETMAYLPKYFSQTKWLAVYLFTIICFALFIFIYNEKILKRLRKRIQTLEININQDEKQKALEEIISTDLYKELTEKANAIKKSGFAAKK
jgi:hypothetical protein